MYEMIQIPKPCAADWQTMTPEGKGRHCNQCCKTVIDFTRWDNTDILAYLKKHAADGVCGRFRKQQLDVPIPTPEVFIRQVNHAPLSFRHRIAVLILFVFGIMTASCNNTGRTTGEPLPQSPLVHQRQDTTATGDHPLIGDTIMPVPDPEQVLQGETVPVTGMPNEPYETLGGAPVLVEPRPVLPADSGTIQHDSLR